MLVVNCGLLFVQDLLNVYQLHISKPEILYEVKEELVILQCSTSKPNLSKDNKRFVEPGLYK